MLVEHAERELKLAGLFDKDADYGGEVAKSVMDLIKLTAAQGHSGASLRQVIDTLCTLVDFDPLSPLTGADDEWHDPCGDGLLQNIRCSHVFKDKKTGKAYDAAISIATIEFPYTPNQT
jgi:hypothetical protein